MENTTPQPASKSKYPNGVYVKLPHEKAREFIVCKISINKNKFGEWIAQNINKDEIYLNFNIFKNSKSKEGISIVLDDWKPDPTKSKNYRENKSLDIVDEVNPAGLDTNSDYGNPNASDIPF